MCFSVQRRKQCQPEATELSEASAECESLRPIALGFWPPVGAPPSGGHVTLWPRESEDQAQADVSAQEWVSSWRASALIRASGLRAESEGNGPKQVAGAPSRPGPHQLGQAPPGEDAARAAEVQVAGAPAPHVEPLHSAGRCRPVLPVQQDQLLLGARSRGLQHPLQLRESGAPRQAAQQRPQAGAGQSRRPARGCPQRSHAGCRLTPQPNTGLGLGGWYPGSEDRASCGVLGPSSVKL